MATIIYPDEITARREIVEAGRRLYSRGFICASDGNLSARLSRDVIIATPGGVSKGFMTEDMLLKHDIDGNILGGYLAPSSELKMHLAIYRQSPGILAVCHAHPPVSATFAAAGVALERAFLQETALFLGTIPVAKYAAPGSEELAYGVAEFCAGYSGALLEHHGTVSWGSSVNQALFRMEGIEQAATIEMYSRAMGFDRTLSKEQIAALAALRP